MKNDTPTADKYCKFSNNAKITYGNREAKRPVVPMIAHNQFWACQEKLYIIVTVKVRSGIYAFK